MTLKRDLLVIMLPSGSVPKQSLEEKDAGAGAAAEGAHEEGDVPRSSLARQPGVPERRALAMQQELERHELAIQELHAAIKVSSAELLDAASLTKGSSDAGVGVCQSPPRLFPAGQE
jgi:hypothetical protein